MKNSARYTGESEEPREGLAPVIVAVSRDSRTSWRTRTPRLYLHCTLAGPRRGNLEGKREQCHARSGAYMRISVRWPGNRHLRIVGCCAEAASQTEKEGGREGDQRLGIALRRHWPPLIFPGAFFYLLPSPPPPPLPPAALRPLHRIALVPLHSAVTLYLARARLFAPSRLSVTPTRTYPPLFLALLSRSDVLSAPSFPPSSLVLSPSFSCPSVPLSPSPFPSLFHSYSFSLAADIRLPLPPTITLRVFLLFAFLPAP